MRLPEGMARHNLRPLPGLDLSCMKEHTDGARGAGGAEKTEPYREPLRRRMRKLVARATRVPLFKKK